MRMGMKVAVAAAVVMVSACSSGDGDPSQDEGEQPVGEGPAFPEDDGGAAQFPEDNFSQRDVVDHLGLTRDSGSLTYDVDGLACEVAVVLTSPAEVSTYVDAGDVVATDPQQRVGVKLVGGPERECFESVTEAFADF